MKLKTLIIAAFAVVCSIAIEAIGFDRWGGQYQIRSFAVTRNYTDRADVSIGLARATFHPLGPSIKVIDPRVTPIYRGENAVIDETLGQYVVVLTFADTWIQDGAKRVLTTGGLTPVG